MIQLRLPLKIILVLFIIEAMLVFVASIYFLNSGLPWQLKGEDIGWSIFYHLFFTFPLFLIIFSSSLIILWWIWIRQVQGEINKERYYKNLFLEKITDSKSDQSDE